MCGAQAGSYGMLLNGVSVAMARSERGRERGAGRGGVRDGGQERVSRHRRFLALCRVKEPCINILANEPRCTEKEVF